MSSRTWRQKKRRTDRIKLTDDRGSGDAVQGSHDDVHQNHYQLERNDNVRPRSFELEAKSRTARRTIVLLQVHLVNRSDPVNRHVCRTAKDFEKLARKLCVDRVIIHDEDSRRRGPAGDVSRSTNADGVGRPRGSRGELERAEGRVGRGARGDGGGVGGTYRLGARGMRGISTGSVAFLGRDVVVRTGMGVGERVGPRGVSVAVIVEGVGQGVLICRLLDMLLSFSRHELTDSQKPNARAVRSLAEDSAAHEVGLGSAVERSVGLMLVSVLRIGRVAVREVGRLRCMRGIVEGREVGLGRRRGVWSVC
jgi:hypothetical protein